MPIPAFLPLSRTRCRMRGHSPGLWRSQVCPLFPSQESYWPCLMIGRFSAQFELSWAAKMPVKTEEPLTFDLVTRGGIGDDVVGDEGSGGRSWSRRHRCTINVMRRGRGKNRCAVEGAEKWLDCYNNGSHPLSFLYAGNGPPRIYAWRLSTRHATSLITPHRGPVLKWCVQPRWPEMSPDEPTW